MKEIICGQVTTHQTLIISDCWSILTAMCWIEVDNFGHSLTGTVFPSRIVNQTSGCVVGQQPDLWDCHSKSCPKRHLPTHADRAIEALNKKIDFMILEEIRVFISRCKFPYSLTCGHTVSRISVRPYGNENRDATWGNQCTAGRNLGEGYFR